MDSLNAGGLQSKVLEAEAEAKQAAIRVFTAKPRDLPVEDCERVLRFAAEHEGGEDPLPPVFFKRLLPSSSRPRVVVRVGSNESCHRHHLQRRHHHYHAKGNSTSIRLHLTMPSLDGVGACQFTA